MPDNETLIERLKLRMGIIVQDGESLFRAPDCSLTLLSGKATLQPRQTPGKILDEENHTTLCGPYQRIAYSLVFIIRVMVKVGRILLLAVLFAVFWTSTFMMQDEDWAAECREAREAEESRRREWQKFSLTDMGDEGQAIPPYVGKSAESRRKPGIGKVNMKTRFDDTPERPLKDLSIPEKAPQN